MKTKSDIKRNNSFNAFLGKGGCRGLCPSKTASPAEGVGGFSREIQDLTGFDRKRVCTTSLLILVFWVVQGS